MPKVKPLTDVENIPAFIQQVNSNFEKVEEALENTLSRDGSTPNEMNASLDMNGQNIINIGGVSFVDGPVVLTDAENVLFDTPVGWTADNVQEGIEEAYQKASDETTLVENSVTTLSGNAVRVDVAQSHSPSEQTQGRDNLGLGDLAVKDSVDVADIDATGTADATTALMGDGSWGIVTGPGIAAGAIGSLVFATYGNPATSVSFGNTVAGSGLYPTGAMYRGNFATGATPVVATLGAALSGTWRCLGVSSTVSQPGTATISVATLWMRIA